MPHQYLELIQRGFRAEIISRTVGGGSGGSVGDEAVARESGGGSRQNDEGSSDTRVKEHTGEVFDATYQPPFGPLGSVEEEDERINSFLENKDKQVICLSAMISFSASF